MIENLDRKKHIATYIDLWTADDEASFIMAMAKGISESMSSDVARRLEIARKFFARFSLSVSPERTVM